MTAGNQTPPGGRSDDPVGPGQAPDGAPRTGTPVDDRTGEGAPADPGEQQAERAAAPVPPIVPARVTMLSRDASGSTATPPNSLPPRRVPPPGDSAPSEMVDPSRPSAPAQQAGPMERFPSSRLFEPFTPVDRTADASARGGMTPQTRWTQASAGGSSPGTPSGDAAPVAPASDSRSAAPTGGDGSAHDDAASSAEQHGTATPEHDTGSTEPGATSDQSGATPDAPVQHGDGPAGPEQPGAPSAGPTEPGSDQAAPAQPGAAPAAPAQDDPPATTPTHDGVAAAGPAGDRAPSAPGDPATAPPPGDPATAPPPGDPATAPPPGDPATAPPPGDPATATGPHGGAPGTAPPHARPGGGTPAAAPPRTPQAAGIPPHAGTGQAPPPVPARAPVPPRPSAAGPSTPPPAPAAPATTGRLRRLPVALLVVLVLVAGLGYVGYRQLTGGPPDGWRTVTSPGYELDVPDTWAAPSQGLAPLSVFGVPFGTAAQSGEYPCNGGRSPRAVAASALIAVPPNVGLDQAATAFARGAGDTLYRGARPQVAVGTPGERQLSTVTGSRVEASVRTDGAGGCRATDATVQVLVVPRTTAPDGSIGAAVLIVSGDLSGGPAQPAPVTRDQLVGVLDTAALSSG